jgi:hypothetical protein
MGKPLGKPFYEFGPVFGWLPGGVQVVSCCVLFGQSAPGSRQEASRKPLGSHQDTTAILADSRQEVNQTSANVAAFFPYCLLASGGLHGLASWRLPGGYLSASRLREAVGKPTK